MRVENQQRVMKAIIKKMTSSKTLLMNYGDIVNVARKNVQTDMSSEEMLALVKMQLTDLSQWDVDSQKIEGEYGMDYVASLSQNQMYSIYKPNEASVSSCQKKIDTVMNPSEEELKEAKENRSKSFFVNLVKGALNRQDTEKDKD